MRLVGRHRRARRATGSIQSVTVAAGETTTVNVDSAFRDFDGDPLTYAASTSNRGVAAASVSGSSVTISGVAPGSATVTVAATDPAGTSATQSFDVTVESRNRAPRATAPLGSRTLAPGETYSINLAEHFRDPDGDPLTYTASTSSPDVATASVSRSRGTISGVAPGSATITVAATDPVGASAEQSFNVTVIDPALRRRRRSTTPRAAPTRRAGRTG